MNMLRKANDWKAKFEQMKMGFLPINQTYQNLDVMIVGLNEPLNLKASAVELLIVQQYWSDFLKGMGVRNIEFVRLNTPGSDKIIQSFLSA
jgi:hypothetical protein